MGMNGNKRGPLSGLQSSFYFERRTSGSSSVILVELKGARLSDPKAVRSVLEALVQRHGALRTRVEEGPQGPEQVEALEGSLQWEEADEALGMEAWERGLEVRFQEGFDPRQGRPLRAWWRRDPDGEGRLALFGDHLALDGISMAHVMTEMSERLGGAVWKPLRSPSLVEGARLLQAARDLRREEEDARYWMERLEAWEADETLPPGMDDGAPRPETACAVQKFSADLVARIERAAQARGRKPLALMAAALSQVWAYWTRRPQVLMNLPVHGRGGFSQLRRGVGAYADIVPLLLPGQGVRLQAAADEAQAAMLESLAHASLSSVELARRLAVARRERPRALSPLTLTSGTFYDWQMAPDLRCLRVHVQSPATWLDLLIFRDGAGWSLTWNHRLDRIGRRRCALMQTQLLALLELLAEDRDGDPFEILDAHTPLPQGGVSVVPPAWREGNLVERFRRMAAEHSEAVAVTAGEASLRYAELDRRSDALAAALQAHGVGRGDRVGIHLERNLDLPVAILGVLKTGAAYVPMDPLYPVERVRNIAEDAELAALVCGPDADPALVPGRPRLSPRQVWSQAPAPCPAGSQDPAYIIYTSGSTGRPKGVVVRHGEVLRLFSATEPWFAFQASDVWTLFHSYGFDFSVWEFFGALCYGGRLVVVPAELARRPAAFHALLRHERVTVLNQTPSAFAALDEADAAAPPEARLDTLRLVIFGGEALNFASLRSWYSRHPEDAPRLVNMYGITETTVHVTYRPLTRADAEAGGPSLIGVPIPDLTLHVLDHRLKPVPEGVTGEICVGGAGLAQGYWRRDELTAQRFVETAWGRLYRSGDLARRLPGGELEYLGRADRQVKIRGYRIELGEIQACLLACPEISAAAVCLRRGPAGDAALAAWVVPRPGRDEVAVRTALKAALERQLPAYMHPALALVASLPLTANGKLDESALPDPWASSVPPAAPENDLEAALLEAWRRRLGRPEAGVEDDFFASGGQSLSAAAFHAEAERLAGRRVPLSVFLERPTVRALARALAAAPAEPDPAAASAAACLPQRWPAPPALAELWAAQHLDPDSPALHIAFVLRGRTALDPALLRERLRALQAAQAALRCALEQDAAGGLWVRPTDAALPWEEDASELPWTGHAEALRAWAARPFDLARAPLWRCRWTRLADAWTLAFCFHHAIFDHRSVELLLECLQSGEVGRAEGLPGLGRLELLPGAAARVTTGPLGPAGEKGGPARRLVRRLDEGLKKGLLAAVARTQATPFAAVCAAWAAALRREGFAGDLRVPLSLRRTPEQEAAIGYGVAPLALDLAQLEGADSRERLAAAAAALRETLARPRWREGAGAELFLVWEAEPGALRIAEQSVELLPLEFEVCKAPLALRVALDARWRLCLEYDASRVEGALAEGLLEAVESELRALAFGKEALPKAEAPLLLRGPLRVPGECRTVPELFRRQVELRPEALALVWRGGSMDYAALGRRVRAVAAFLLARGLRPGARVGVHMAPGPQWAASLLGCLEAGLSYVPLDPALPEERLRVMVEEAACACVLSDREAFFGPAVDCLDVERAWTYTQPHGVASGRPRPEDEAYVIFTSGSTGRPRGVRLPHRALENLALGFSERLDLKPGDRVLQFVSISFDASLEELLPALCVGAAVALPCRQGAPAPEELLEQVRELGATILHLPAAYWHACMRADAGPLLGAHGALRALVLGGEAPDPALALRLAREAPTLVLYNAYGPTEAGVTAFMHRRAAGEQGSLPLGRPLSGVTAVVVDAEGAAQPLGRPGELWLGGAGLALGYLDPAQDAGRFVRRDFGDGERLWYRSGDRVRWDLDGHLYYAGRLDREVKIAGQRVDLEGVEAALAALPGVAQALVERRGEGEDAHLKAWILPAPGAALQPQALRAALLGRLPKAQVPDEILLLASLPLTRNGKVDRAALDASVLPAAPRALGAPKPVPEAPKLAELCALWGRLLGPAAARPDADFFALGGTSLKAVRAVSEAMRILGHKISVRDLRRWPTPAALAAAGLAAGRSRAASASADGPAPGWRRLAGGASGFRWLLLPAAGMDATPFEGLARELAAQGAVWMLEAPPVDRRLRPGPAWRALVEACLEGLPMDEPFGLLGWSVGGLLAAALAPRLLERRAPLTRLVLLDALPPEPLQRAALAAGAEWPEGLQRRAGGEPAEDFNALVRASLGFEPEPLELPLTLVLSRESVESRAAAALAWAPLARAGLWTLLLPGGHLDLLEHGGAEALAARLAGVASPLVPA